MAMRMIIAGGRNYVFTQFDYDVLDLIHLRFGVSEVVSGKARGADTSGEVWAAARSIPVAGFPADWDALGRPAGHIRNAQMAEYADAVVLFPGGKGTDSMAKLALNNSLRIWDFRGVNND